MATLLDKPVQWLADILWEDVVAVNAALCGNRNALHKLASGSAAVSSAWDKAVTGVMTFYQLAEFLLRCHRTAPFCFLNGNTFSAIARDLLADVPMTEAQATRTRSVTGHAIAGVLPIQELRDVLNGIELPPSWEFPGT